MKTVISVENLSKSYRLGQIGTGTLSRDLEVWWAKVRGKPNPLLKIGQEGYGMDDGGRKTEDRSPVPGPPSLPFPRPPSETLWALKDVSFQVQQGEVLGIIGRNGAGKSTLLKILSRVTAPTSGQVKVRGRIASLLEVGTGFHPELTGRENIFLNGAILGMSKQEVQRKFDEIVSFAEVEKFVDTPVKRYSSGMYVRLAFAVAAHLESEILLVDEVLAVGDAEFQKKCLGKMGDVATNEGRTVLFVSHNMAAVKTLCSEGIFLENGLVTYSGIVENTIVFYQNRNLSNKKDFIIDNYRSTKGFEIIEKIWVNNEIGNVIPKFIIGSNVTINILLKNKYNLRKINIGIGVNNEIGERIFTIQTINQNKIIVFNDNQLIIQCTIKNLNIIPGLYFLKIALADMYRDIDIIDNYPGFEIIPSDYYGSGKIPSKVQGLLIVDATWNEIK